MNEEIIVVPKLSIHVVTGETCYPGENGFSAHYAQTSPEIPELEEKLTEAHQKKKQITLRCAMFDAIGTISKIKSEEDPTTFNLTIDDIIYRNPKKHN